MGCRLDIGLPKDNGKKHVGCFARRSGFDSWGSRNGAPVNLLYFMGDQRKCERRALHFPSLDIQMFPAEHIDVDAPPTDSSDELDLAM